MTDDCAAPRSSRVESLVRAALAAAQDETASAAIAPKC